MIQSVLDRGLTIEGHSDRVGRVYLFENEQAATVNTHHRKKATRYLDSDGNCGDSLINSESESPNEKQLCYSCQYSSVFGAINSIR